MTAGFRAAECALVDGSVMTPGGTTIRPMTVVHHADGRREVSFVWGATVWRMPLAPGKDRGVAATWSAIAPT
jgi:hypothetical protein